MNVRIIRQSNVKPANGGLRAHRIVLAEYNDNFVTWQQNVDTDGHDFYWGHYYPKWNADAASEASKDFEERIKKNGFVEAND